MSWPGLSGRQSFLCCPARTAELWRVRLAALAGRDIYRVPGAQLVACAAPNCHPLAWLKQNGWLCNTFVATAAYSDNGHWYVPTIEEFPKGGYEPSVTWAADRCLETGKKIGVSQLENEYRRAITSLLQSCSMSHARARGSAKSRL